MGGLWGLSLSELTLSKIRPESAGYVSMVGDISVMTSPKLAFAAWVR